jgi:hypothetical protein
MFDEMLESRFFDGKLYVVLNFGGDWFVRCSIGHESLVFFLVQVFIIGRSNQIVSQASE